MSTFKIKPKRKNPGTLLFSAKPKIGKTTKLTELKNNLIINLEKNGSDFLENIDVIDCSGILEANTKDIKALLTTNIKTKVLDLGDITNPIHRLKAMQRITAALVYFSQPYDYVSIDTITQADIDSEWLGTENYMDSLQGKTYNREKDTSKPTDEWERYEFGHPHYQSVIEIGQNGWRWSRGVMTDILESTRNASKKCTIYVAHVKEKLLSKPDKGEVYIKDIALTGAVADIYCRNVDAVASMYKDDKTIMISFVGNEDRTGGNRGEAGAYEGVFDWDKIFLPEDKAEDKAQDKAETEFVSKTTTKPAKTSKTKTKETTEVAE